MVPTAFRPLGVGVAGALACLLLAVTAPAGAQHFGKNSVQGKDWKRFLIQTDRFDVYFYESERGAAVDAARMAERSYACLSRILAHQVDGKIPLRDGTPMGRLGVFVLRYDMAQRTDLARNLGDVHHHVAIATDF